MAGETVVGALRYNFEADTSGLKAGLNQTQQALKKATDSVKETAKEFGALGKEASDAVKKIATDADKSKDALDKLAAAAKDNAKKIGDEFAKANDKFNKGGGFFPPRGPSGPGGGGGGGGGPPATPPKGPNDNDAIIGGLDRWQKSRYDMIGKLSEAAKKGGENAAKATKLASHEMLNFSRQLSDVGTSLVGGMSPFMILAQQGPQIADILKTSGVSAADAFKQIGSAAAKSLINIKTLGLGAGAVIAGIGVAALSSVHHLETLVDTAKALGTNRNALNELNRQGGILGMDPAKMNEEMLAFAQSIRRAQIAGGDLADKLASVGINVKNFDLDKAGEFARLFALIGEKVRTGSNELDKLNALKLLGLSNEFKRVFEDGREAVARFARESASEVESGAKDISSKWQDLRRIASDVWSAIVTNAIDYIWQFKNAWIEACDAIAAALADLTVKAEKSWEKLKLAGNWAKQLGTLTPGQVSEYNSKMQSLNLQSDAINQDAKSAKPLPTISVGGTDLSHFSDDKNKKTRAKKDTDKIKEYIENLREAASIAQAEADNWSKGNIEREKAMALVKAENIAKQEGRTLTAAQREEILALSGQEQIAKQRVDELKYSQDRLNDAMQEFGDQVSRSLEDLIIRGQKASEVLRQLISQLASSALRGMLTGEGMFGKLFGMAGDKDGGLGGILGKAISFLPKFASGGTLGAGRWGIAGEAGPELVKGPAHITPFGKMGSQGARVTVHNYSGAPVQTRQMSDGEILVMVGNMIQSNNKRVPGLVADAQRRSI